MGGSEIDREREIVREREMGEKEGKKRSGREGGGRKGSRERRGKTL